MDKEILLKLLSSSDVSDKDSQVLALLSQLTSIQESENVISLDEQIENLKRLRIRLSQQHQFKVGDIVRWKDGLKNRRMPEYKRPAVVVEILSSPIYDEKAEVGSPYFREKLDFVLGIIIKDELLTFHYDSKRFELFEMV